MHYGCLAVETAYTVANAVKVLLVLTAAVTNAYYREAKVAAGVLVKTTTYLPNGFISAIRASMLCYQI